MLRTRNRRAIVCDVLADLQDNSEEDSEWDSYEIENKSVYTLYIGENEIWFWIFLNLVSS